MHNINTPESFSILKIISVGQEENNLQNQNVAVVWFQITLLSSEQRKIQDKNVTRFSGQLSKTNQGAS